jgi:AraC-like DNA-binding protein
MSEPFDSGVLYTEHAPLAVHTPFPSLWSYDTCARGSRPPVMRTADGRREYWLHRSDPLLNTMLPGTHVSLVVNLGDRWASGGSLAATSLVPLISVVGPLTRPRLLRVGRHVRAAGAVLPPLLARDVFGVPAAALVDQIVPLEELWAQEHVDRLRESVAARTLPSCVAALRDALMGRMHSTAHPPAVERAMHILSTRRAVIRIDDLAERVGLSRQRFARRFHDAVGVSPKHFARIVRFQGLVHALLSTDVSQWAAVAPGMGFYDQAHMINEFRSFTGSPPTSFFKPHDDAGDDGRIQLRGRPSEWLRRS